MDTGNCIDLLQHVLPLQSISKIKSTKNRFPIFLKKGKLLPLMNTANCNNGRNFNYTIASLPAKENPVNSDMMIIFFWTNPVKDSKD